MMNSDKVRTIALWILRVLLAAAFLAAGGTKIAGVQSMIDVFEKLGIGQWFRVVTGLLEVGGAILLLIPRLTFYGAALLLLIMASAVIAELTVIGGNPTPALVFFVLTALTAWLTRGAWRKSLIPQQ